MALSTMFPKFSTKADGDTIIMEQRLLKKVSHLVLNVKKCTGCGICADTCPKEAIALGKVGVAGEAPITVDPAKCSYCGVCTIMCPFNALAVEVDGALSLPIKDQEGYPEYDFTAEIDDEKCNRCTTCSDACPHNAIVRDVPVYEGEEGTAPRQSALAAKTEFAVDKEKCDACGICASLCPALTLKRKSFSAEKVESVGNIVWNEAKCDACNVCADACPKKAITVKRTVTAGAKLAGKVSIDKEECVTCSWCKTVCPEEAVKVTKIFDGDIALDTSKCPKGCSVCADICPCKAIDLSAPAGKGPVNKDLCILCGACVNACPSEDAIVLKRTAVHFKGTVTDLAKKVEAKLCAQHASKKLE